MSAAHWVQIYASNQTKWTNIYGGATFDLGTLVGDLAPALTVGSLSFLINTPQVYFDLEMPLETELVPSLTAAATLAYVVAGPMALGTLNASIAPTLSAGVSGILGLNLLSLGSISVSLAPTLTAVASFAPQSAFNLGTLQAVLAPVLTTAPTIAPALFIPFNLGSLSAELAPQLSLHMDFDITQRLEWAAENPPTLDSWTHQSTLVS